MSSEESVATILVDVPHSPPKITENLNSIIYNSLLVLNQDQFDHTEQIITHESIPTDSHTNHDMAYQVNLVNETEPTLLPEFSSEMPQSMTVENGQTHFLHQPSTVLDNQIPNSTKPFVHQTSYPQNEPIQEAQHEQEIDSSVLQQSVLPFVFQIVQNVDNIQEQQQQQEQPQAQLEQPEKHKNAKRFQCDRCVNTFKSKNNLVQHYRTHTGEKPYKCAICGMAFTQRNQQIKHMKYQHNDTKVAIDSQVTQVVNQQQTIEPDPTVEQRNKQIMDRQTECQTSEQQLENDNFDSTVAHVEAQQTATFESTQQTLEDEKKFKCKVCKKCFKKFCQLTQHQVTHIDVMLFKCELCKKGFKRRCELKQHLITHSDTMQFKCELCKKGFKRSYDLKMHQYTHSNDKPFACALCKSCYKRPWDLKLHMKDHMKQQKKQEINVETIWDSEPTVEPEFTFERVHNEHPNELDLMQQSIKLMNRQDQEMFWFKNLLKTT